MNNELLNIMEKCGHFLYHRRGGKRGQIRILNLLDKSNGVTQKELLQNIPIKSGSMSEMVSKLEAQGFILKERDKEDRRKINIILTPKGKSFLDRQLAINREQEKDLFTSLTPEEQQLLIQLLNKLFDDWKSKFDSDIFNHRKEEGNV